MATTGRVVETPVFLRNSERKTYRRCRLQWKWHYVDRWQKPSARGVLTFGQGVHHALEHYYPIGRKRGPHPALTFEQWFKANEHHFHQWDDEGNKHDALELGIAMLKGYVEQWGVDDHIEIIAPEMAMSVDIYDKTGRYLRTFVLRADAAFEDLSKRRGKRRRIGYMEHKTAKQVDGNLRINSGYGDQGLGYAWAGSQVLRELDILQPGDSVDHVLYNWLRKGMPDTRPVNDRGMRLNKPGKEALMQYCLDHEVQLLPKKSANTIPVLMELIAATGYDPLLLGEVSANQGAPLFVRDRLDFGDHEMQQTGWRIMAEAYEMEQVLAGKLPIFKNPTKDCSWDCDFVEACELHEMGADWESILELEFVKGDPYEDYEREIK